TREGGHPPTGPGHPGRDASGHGRRGGVSAAAGREERADHDADRPRRDRRPGAGPRQRRGRLRSQAVRLPGAAGSGARPGQKTAPAPQAQGLRRRRARPRRREARRCGRLVSLTGTEFELLCHFVRNPRRVLSRDQILDAVWGYDFGATSNVVDVYVGYVRAKLGEPRLIHTVRGIGYVLTVEE